MNTCRLCASSVLLIVAGGCVLAPRAAKLEREKLEAAGQPFQRPFEERSLPDLPPQPSWRDVVGRALLANGEVEAAYFEWDAAMARIAVAAGYPNTNLAIPISTIISGQTTVGLAIDSMENLLLLPKVIQAGKAALDEARAAGKRFDAVRFKVQRRVLDGYLDLALLEERIRIQESNVALLKVIADSSVGRVQAGASQHDLLKARIEVRMAEDKLRTLVQQREAMRATLNGMLARDAGAPLSLPKALPEHRPITSDDATLIAQATVNNPELAALALGVRGRENALELARLEYLPDINPSVQVTTGNAEISGTESFRQNGKREERDVSIKTGGTEWAVGGMIIVPIALSEIGGRVQEARAMLREGQAMSRQAQFDARASFVAALYMLRNSERQADLFERDILPAAEQVVATAKRAYTTASLGLLDMVESQRTLLDVRLTVAEARIEREKRLAELEALAGTPIESLGDAKADATTK